MIGGDTDGPSIREEPLICSCDICCQNMKSRGEPMPHINHHLNDPAHPKSRNRIGKTVFLVLTIVLLLFAVSCNNANEANGADLHYDFEATDGTYTLYASGETSSSPQVYTFRLFKGDREASEPLTVQMDGDRYDDFRKNWIQNVSGEEPQPMEIEISGLKATVKSATETVTVDFEARTTSLSQNFPQEEFKEFSKSPDGLYSLGTYETPLTLFCLVRNNNTNELCYLTTYGAENTGSDTMIWAGSHDLYRLLDHSIIAYDVERALTIYSPFSLSIEDQIRYITVGVDADEGVCALLFELIGYDELFVSIYDSNRLLLDCINTHMKKPDGIDTFQRKIALSVADGTVAVTVDGDSVFSQNYK